MHLELERDRLYVTVDALILTVREGRLYALLSRRKNPPFQGRWALPGRLVGLDEPVEATLDGLLAEMMPEGPRFYEQLYTFSDLNRDPRGRVISIAHLVAVPEAPSGGLTSFEIRLERAANLPLTTAGSWPRAYSGCGARSTTPTSPFTFSPARTAFPWASCSPYSRRCSAARWTPATFAGW